MGSPATLANLELSEEVLAGRTVATAVGDAPDWYYRIAMPEQVRGAFTFEGITAEEFYEEAQARGVPVPARTAADRFVCLKVLPTGWSWGAFIAHCLMQDFIEEHLPSCSPDNRVVQGLPAPLLGEQPVAHWEYIDDYGLLTLEEAEDTTQAGSLAAEAHEAFASQLGLHVHKEAVTPGLGRSLGCSISQGRPELRVADDKLVALCRATWHVASMAAAVTPLAMQRLMGHWTWIGLVCREFLSVGSAVSAFLRLEPPRGPKALWPSVKLELLAMAALGPFLKAELWPPGIVKST